ncbi:MAG: NUDIX hydrolase [bacterium]
MSDAPLSPALAVDIIIQTPEGIVLIHRANPPYQDKWCLPGGFVDIGETCENAARREAEEETGLVVRIGKLVGVYSDPQRDPRRHVVSVCYTAVPISGTLKAADDAREVRTFQSLASGQLGFDHAQMCEEAGVLVMNQTGFSDHD